MALQSLDSKGLRRVMKRRRKNERMYRRAFRWNTYIRPLIDMVGRSFSGR